ncbi:MAG: hypothetical protein ABWK01_01995 [Infirmifilum sp.]
MAPRIKDSISENCKTCIFYDPENRFCNFLSMRVDNPYKPPCARIPQPQAAVHTEREMDSRGLDINIPRRTYYSKEKGGMRKVAALLVLALIVYLLLLYETIASIDARVESADFPSLGDLISFPATRRLNFNVKLRLTSKGILPVTVRSVSFKVYVEEVYIGTVRSTESFTVEPGVDKTIPFTFTLDASSISPGDVVYAIQSAANRGGNVVVRLDGYMEPIVILVPVEIPAVRSYTLNLGSPAPRSTPQPSGKGSTGFLSIQDAYWTVNNRMVTSCKLGDTVVAHVVVKAEGGPVSGTLTIKIKEDLAALPDSVYVVSTPYVSLREGETRDIEVSFIARRTSGVIFRGYFIEVEGLASWTMPSSYPPRLRVEG